MLSKPESSMPETQPSAEASSCSVGDGSCQTSCCPCWSMAGLMMLISCVMLVCFGCQNESAPAPPVAGHDDHDHDHGHAHGDHEGHEHPETLADAVKELTELRDSIRDAFAKNDVEAAHDPLHEVGHILGEVVELAEKDDHLSAEARAMVAKSVEDLMDSFGAVDKKLHDEEGGKSYTDVAEQIDAAVKSIVDATTDHDHDHAAEAATGKPVSEEKPAAADESEKPATETRE